MTQCERDLPLSSTCLMAPQRSRKIFVTPSVATQQHEETSCAMEQTIIPLREEEKKDNLTYKLKEEPTPMKSRKKVLSYQMDNENLAHH